MVNMTDCEECLNLPIKVEDIFANTNDIVGIGSAHQKLIYLSILKNQKNIFGGTDVFKYYLETCESYNMKPLSERRVRTLVVNLTELGLIESEVGWLSDEGKKTRKVTVMIDSAVKSKAVKLLRDSI